jgi:hypothetical protein
MTNNSKSTRRSAIEQLAANGASTHPEVIKFREEKILHEHFQEGLNRVAERIQYSEQQGITAVIGPTASGKTALCNEFAFQFTEAITRLPTEAQSTILVMELAAPETGAFKWRDDFYIPALEALKEPCVKKKINLEELQQQLNAGNTQPLNGRKPKLIVDYRADFYDALERGKVAAALFDEANHLRRPNSKHGVFGQYDSLKSRSNACATHFVLLGTTELTDIFSQSGSISKRVYPVWLNPYSIDELAQFTAGVLGIVEKLPIKITFSVTARIKMIHRHCIGLFGEAHDWFDRALVSALFRGKESISWADMQAVAKHELQLAGIVRDVVKFKEESANAMRYLKEQMSTLFVPKTGASFGSEAPQNSDASTQPAKNSKARTKPGERKPTRDPVDV